MRKRGDVGVISGSARNCRRRRWGWQASPRRQDLARRGGHPDGRSVSGWSARSASRTGSSRGWRWSEPGPTVLDRHHLGHGGTAGHSAQCRQLVGQRTHLPLSHLHLIGQSSPNLKSRRRPAIEAHLRGVIRSSWRRSRPTPHPEWTFSAQWTFLVALRRKTSTKTRTSTRGERPPAGRRRRAERI